MEERAAGLRAAWHGTVSWFSRVFGCSTVYMQDYIIYIHTCVLWYIQRVGKRFQPACSVYCVRDARAENCRVAVKCPYVGEYAYVHVAAMGLGDW